MILDANKLAEFRAVRLMRKCLKGEDAAFYDLVDLTMTDEEVDAACEELRHEDGTECTAKEFSEAYWAAVSKAVKK